MNEKKSIKIQKYIEIFSFKMNIFKIKSSKNLNKNKYKLKS